MARDLKPGEKLNGYTVVALIHAGPMAVSYAAESPEGVAVFLKQYFVPAPETSWYSDFIAFQGELYRRMESGAARNFACRRLDAFEAKVGTRTFFQVFEYFPECTHLGHILSRSHEVPGSLGWDQRVLLAKVIAHGLGKLHEAGIIHCDLKPANILLAVDRTIAAGYQVKIADMDFALLESRKAPWHGQQKYVGTTRYFSPEHNAGSVPGTLSDAFTCGIILSELLAGQHPYASALDGQDYQGAILAYRADRARLLGELPEPADNAWVEELLYRCLSPVPLVRPSTRELSLALNGRLPRPEEPAAPPYIPEEATITDTADPTESQRGFRDAPKPVLSSLDEANNNVHTPAAAAVMTPVEPLEYDMDLLRGTVSQSLPPLQAPMTEEQPAASGGSVLYLISASGNGLRLNTPSPIGKFACAHLGPDARFMSRLQYVVDRDEEGGWVITPESSAQNETILNGEPIHSATPLRMGDIIGVGRVQAGVVRLPMRVVITAPNGSLP